MKISTLILLICSVVLAAADQAAKIEAANAFR